MALFNLFFGKKKDEEEDDGSEYFIENPDTDALPDEMQFGISLSQVIGEHNNFYIDSLEAKKDVDSCKESMRKWYRISNSQEAHDFIQSRTKEGFRTLYNNIIDLYLKTNGNAALLPKNDWGDEIAGYFENLSSVLPLEEGKEWFPNPQKDFLVGCDAYDYGRIAFVARSCYTAGYITAGEAWAYIDEIARMARKSFNNWEDYGKSYLLGRALWCGNSYDDFNDFAEVTRYLVEDEDSPWVMYEW